LFSEVVFEIVKGKSGFAKEFRAVAAIMANAKTASNDPLAGH
jgi:hypothetical protein